MKNHNKQTIRTILTLGLALGFTSITAHAQENKAPEKPSVIPTPALTVGDEFPKNALEGITWIQGDAVKSLDEEGKVYIIECWATWCGPCIRVIPHVNELHQKFADKGLVIIGMNVFEDGIEKSEAFVKKMGGAMSYRVAYSGGRQAAFADNVLKPAKVTGIPRALVIKGGKLILSIHPSQLTTERVAGIIDGSFDSATYAKEQAAIENERLELRAKITAIYKANDWDGLKKLANELDDTNFSKFNYLANAAAKSNNWEDLLALRKDIANNRFGPRANLATIDTMVVRDSSLSADNLAGAKKYADIALTEMPELLPNASPKSGVFHYFKKARLNFMATNTEDAQKNLGIAKEWLDKFTEPRTATLYETLINNSIKSVDQNKFPPMSESINKAK